MDLSQLFNKLLTTKTAKELGLELYNRVRLLSLLFIVSIIFNSFFTVYYLINDDLSRFIFNSLFLVVLVIFYLIIRTSTDITVPTLIAVLVIFFYMIDLLISGGTGNSGLLWMFIFPNLLMFLAGFKRGRYLILALFGIIIAVTLLRYFGMLETAFSVPTMILFISVYSFHVLMVFYYEYIRSASYRIITQQKNELDSLYRVTRSERSQLTAILESIADGVLVLDKEKKILLVNNAALSMSGFTSIELIGFPYAEKLKFVFAQSGEENRDFVNNVFEKGEPAKMESPTDLITKDGTRLAVADSAAPIHDSEGKFMGVVIVFRDVTREREIDKMKSEFVSLASHQLKTPLTAIKYLLELITGPEAEIGKKERETINMLGESTERLVKLVDDLLDVSRIETGRKFNIIPTRNNLNQLISEVVEEQKPIAERKHIVINMQLDATANMDLAIDKDKMYQVFKNLLSNAVKYSKDESSVEIQTEKEELFVRVHFIDHGIGIPEKDQPRIFEKLFRADNAQIHTDDGTGLGMYIAKAIVEAHGGTIAFTSKEGEGTTFTVSLKI